MCFLLYCCCIHTVLIQLSDHPQILPTASYLHLLKSEKENSGDALFIHTKHNCKTRDSGIQKQEMTFYFFNCCHL